MPFFFFFFFANLGYERGVPNPIKSLSLSHFLVSNFNSFLSSKLLSLFILLLSKTVFKLFLHLSSSSSSFTSSRQMVGGKTPSTTQKKKTFCCCCWFDTKEATTTTTTTTTVEDLLSRVSSRIIYNNKHFSFPFLFFSFP